MPYLRIKDKEAVIAIKFQQFKNGRFNKKAKKTTGEINMMEEAYKFLHSLKENQDAVLETS